MKNYGCERCGGIYVIEKNYNMNKTAKGGGAMPQHFTLSFTGWFFRSLPTRRHIRPPNISGFPLPASPPAHSSDKEFRLIAGQPRPISKVDIALTHQSLPFKRLRILYIGALAL